MHHSRSIVCAALWGGVLALGACGGGSHAHPPDAAESPDGASRPDAPLNDPDGGQVGTPDAAPDATPLGPALFVIDNPLPTFSKWLCETAPPPPQTITVTNAGASPGSFEVRDTSGDVDQFVLTGARAATLGPGESVAFELALAPSAMPPNGRISPTARYDVIPLGDATGGVTVIASGSLGGGYAWAQGHGHGELSWGDRGIGSTTSTTFQISNEGDEPATYQLITDGGAAWTFTFDGVVGDQLTLDPGEAKPATVAFTPTSTGDYAASWSLVPVGSACYGGLSERYTASVAAGALRTSGDLEFGTTACGATASAQVVTLSNAGGSALTWSATLTAGASSPFTLSPSAGSIAAGGSVMVTITPKPAPAQAAALPLDLSDTLVITPSVGDPTSLTLRQELGGALLRWDRATPISLQAAEGQTVAAGYLLQNVGTLSGDVTLLALAADGLVLDGASTRTIAAGAASPVRLMYTPGPGAERVTTDVATIAGAGVCAAPSAMPHVSAQPLALDSIAVASDLYEFSEANCTSTPNPIGVPVTNTTGNVLEMVVSADEPFVAWYEGEPLDPEMPLTFAPGETKIIEVHVESASVDRPDVRQGWLALSAGPVTRRVQLRARYGGAWITATAAQTGRRAAGTLIEQIVTLRNTGTRAGRVTLEHAHGPFRTVTVPAGGTAQVVYDRTVPTGAFADLVAVSAADTSVCVDPSDVVISGTGEVTPMAISTTQLAFEPVLCDAKATPGWQQIKVKNTAGVAITVSAAAERGLASAFEVVPQVLTISPGSYGYVSVRPKSVDTGSPGRRDEFIRLASSTGAQQRVLVATTVEGLVVDAPPLAVLNYAPVEVNADVRLAVPLRMNTNDYLDGLSFAISGDANGEFSTVRDRAFHYPLELGYRPTVVGDHDITFQLTADASVPLCAPLPTTAIHASAPAVDANLDVDVLEQVVRFTTVGCGDTPAPRGFTMVNHGANAVPFTVTRLGDSPWGNVVASPAAGVLAAGQSLAVTLTAPAAPTTFSTQGTMPLDLVRDDTAVWLSNAFEVDLGGELFRVHAIGETDGDWFHLEDLTWLADTPTAGSTLGGVHVTFPASQPSGVFTFTPAATAPCALYEQWADGGIGFDFACPTAGAGAWQVDVAGTPGRAVCTSTGTIASYP